MSCLRHLLPFLVLPAFAAIASAALPWKPPNPPADDFDWIQLTSGEWLKGEIKGMEFEKLTFDSEKLKLHTIDSKDLAFVRSPRSFDILRTDTTVATGPIEIDTTTVRIGGRSFPRDEVKAFSVSGPRGLRHWSGEISAGAILRSGNTESLDVTYHVGVTRRTAATRLEVDYTQNLSETDSEQTADNRRGSVNFDKFISGRAFIRLPSAEYLQDRFQNIARRVTLGTSFGYDLIQGNITRWDTTLGPAWQSLEYYSVQPGESLINKTGAIVLTTHFESDLTKDLSVTFDYRGQLTKKEAGEHVHHAECKFEMDLTKRLEFDLTFTWDRVTNPKENDAGVVPKPDDFRLALALSLTL